MALPLAHRRPACANSERSFAELSASAKRDILKSVGYFRPQRVADIYAAVDVIVQDEVIPASVVRDALQVSRSAYYARRGAPPTASEEQDMELMPLVRTIFNRHKRRYGARRIGAEVQDLGNTCGVRRASQLLQIQGLKAIQPKSFKPRTI